MSALLDHPQVNALRARWLALDAHHRSLWTGIAMLLGGVLAWALLWQPAMREQQRLVARVAEVRAQMAAFERDAAEAKRLVAMPAAAAPAAVADSAAIKALFGDGATVVVEAGGGFRINAPRMAYARWWAALGEAQRRFGLTASRVELQPLPDRREDVTVDLSLHPAKGAAR